MRLRIFLALLLGHSLGFTSPVQAQVTFNVNTTTDGGDADPTDGQCLDANGNCTLRAAMMQATTTADEVIINLPEVPGSAYEWTNGQLYLNAGEITVNGGGTRTTIVDAAQLSRFLDLGGGLTYLHLNDLAFHNGFDPNDPGGGIETDCDDFVLTNVAIVDCATGIGFGGGIHNRGAMEAYGCLFQGCTAQGNDGANGGGGGGGALGAGGGVSCWQTSSSLFENCTFSGCSALGGDGGNGGPGGNGGLGGQSFTNFGEGGDGGDIGGWNSDPDGNAGQIGGGGGGGGYDNGWNGGPGGGGNGLIVGGNAVDGSAQGGGGGGGGGALGGAFFSRAGDHVFRHCTFGENVAEGGTAGTSMGFGNAGDGWGRGGAIGTFAGTITMDNCLLYGNSGIGAPAGDDDDLYLYNGGTILSDLGNNLVGVMDVDAVFDVASLGNQIGVDPVLLPFGDYGGPTDGYMLSACAPISPAIDMGAPLGVANDQRGEPRDANPDIGAMEGPAPVDLLPLFAEVCPGETVQLSLTWPGATTTWPDGSVGDDWTTGAIAGALATITTAEGCNEDVSVDVSETAIAVPDLGPDFSECPPTPGNPTGTLFDGGNAANAATYTWELDGALVGINPTYTLEQEGILQVTVTVGACQTSDEVEVSWYDSYPLELGPDITLCQGESVTLDAEVAGWGGLPPVFAWTGGPADAEYDVAATGSYAVSATTTDGCVTTDEVGVVQSPLTTVNLGADQTICPGTAFTLDPGYPGATVQWQDGSVSPTFNVVNTGIYSANVTLGDCQANDQVFIEVVTPFDAALPASVNFCDGDSVLLLAAFGASNYTWQDGSVGNQLWASLPGIYEVTSVLDGCSFTDQVNVVPTPLPVFDFGSDIILCEGESVTLDPGVAGADYVIFNGTLTTPTLEVDEDGTYTAEVALGGCTFSDEVSVEVRPIPVFDLPEDTTLCPGDVLTLETGLTDVLVTWSTGEVGTALDVNQALTYVATSQVSGCEHVDSTMVDISLPIAVPLAVDYDLCLDDTLTLDARQAEGVYESSYRWDDGSMEPLRIIERPGTYSVEVANVCDTVEHVLEVEQIVCDCQYFIPTAFTPNNDGKNDAWAPVLNCDWYDFKFTVFDRWGRIVFQSLDPEEVWYGQVEGTPGSQTRESGNSYAIDGVYMWELVIELRRGRIPEIIRDNGYVRVLR